MILNYLKVALRNMRKQRFFTLINLLGMSAGITTAILITLFVVNELSYDRFHPEYQRTYQMGLRGKIGGQDIVTATTAPPMAEALVREIPEVEASVRIRTLGDVTFRYGEKAITQSEVMYADSNFFSFFKGYKLIKGEVESCLVEPNTLVLTEKTAQKYFGSEEPLGKIIVVGDLKRAYRITGIVAEPPVNSHFHFNALLSSATSDEMKNLIWLNNFLYTYIRIRPEVPVDEVESKLITLVEKYIGPEMEKFMGMNLTQLKASGGSVGYYTVPLASIHLNSPSRDNIEIPGNINQIYLYMVIGVFTLLIACINFMNLATARSAGRAKEVGLRKTLGSGRSQMILQFLGESVLYSFIAVLLALVFAYTLLPAFSSLTGKALDFTHVYEPDFLLGLVALVLVVGIIAGSYPAFYLTSFKPVEVLKGKVRAGLRSKGIRSTLVVLQFGISIFLIIFTLVVFRQINYMQEQNLGLDKSNTLIINNTHRLEQNIEGYREAMSSDKGVEITSFTNNSFPGVNNTTVFRQEGDEQDHIMGLYYADYNHLDLMKMTLVEGRNFSKDRPSDSLALILNESAIREFGIKNPLGAKIMHFENGEMVVHEIIGVVKNFNFESYRTNVRPIAIGLTTTSHSLMIRYDGNISEIISVAERNWKQLASGEPFTYTFLDSEFDKLFKEEKRMGETFTILSGLTIFIAALGLFALAAFTAEQRTKEIGIRKAMGASTAGLTYLLSKEFTMLVLIAFVPAAIAGWYFSNQWLTGFAYRSDLSWWIFILSGVFALVVAWLTVSWQSIKTARANPVNSLRYE